MSVFNNIGDMITSIKMDLGIYSIALPVEDVNQFLMDVIRLKTLPTFSIFCPSRFSFGINLNQLPCIENSFAKSRYILPDTMFPGRRILYILDVNQKSNLPGAGYATSVYAATVDTYQGAMLTQINANLVSTITPPFTWELEDHNVMVLYNASCLLGNVNIELGIEHSDNLSTIKATQWNSFYELAFLDIKAALYNLVKHYDELSTAYATISMKINDWENAVSERQDLLEKWKDIYHVDLPTYLIV